MNKFCIDLNVAVVALNKNIHGKSQVKKQTQSKNAKKPIKKEKGTRQSPQEQHENNEFGKDNRKSLSPEKVSGLYQIVENIVTLSSPVIKDQDLSFGIDLKKSSSKLLFDDMFSRDAVVEKLESLDDLEMSNIKAVETKAVPLQSGDELSFGIDFKRNKSPKEIDGSLSQRKFDFTEGLQSAAETDGSVEIGDMSILADNLSFPDDLSKTLPESKDKEYELYGFPQDGKQELFESNETDELLDTGFLSMMTDDLLSPLKPQELVFKKEDLEKSANMTDDLSFATNFTKTPHKHVQFASTPQLINFEPKINDDEEEEEEGEDETESPLSSSKNSETIFHDTPYDKLHKFLRLYKKTTDTSNKVKNATLGISRKLSNLPDLIPCLKNSHSTSRVLQALANVSPFRDYFANDSYSKDLMNKSCDRKFISESLSIRISNLFNAIENTNQHLGNLSFSQFLRTFQEKTKLKDLKDSALILSSILQHLDSELSIMKMGESLTGINDYETAINLFKNEYKTNTSFIRETFSLLTYKTIKCLNCVDGKESQMHHSFQHHFMLNLELHLGNTKIVNLEDALKWVKSMEHINYQCQRCGKPKTQEDKSGAIEEKRLFNLPNVLILSLKISDRNLQSLYVACKEVMNFGYLLDDPNSEEHIYDLVSVMNHPFAENDSRDFAQLKINGTWYKYSSDSIEKEVVIEVGDK